MRLTKRVGLLLLLLLLALLAACNTNDKEEPTPSNESSETAGYPALTVPAGYAEDGTPQGTVFVGRFLSEPQLLAVGMAYEQGAQARVAPDLEATMGLIAAIKPAPDTAPAELVEADGLAAKLGGLTYSGILLDQPVTLTGGVGTYADENTGQPYVQLVDQLIPTGDLDGDGAEDAAAFLVDNSTGSADFVYLVAVLSARTDPQPLEAIMIGDRTPVKSLAIEGGEIIAEFIGPGPDDVACCPTRNMRQVFQLQDGGLVMRGSEDLGEASLAGLQGTNWRLVELNLDQEPALPETEITLRFEEDEISGSTGCSTYSSSIAAGEYGLPQSLMVGPISAAQSSCTDSVSQQETAYLDLLAAVIAWRYDFGRLSLTYKIGEEGLGELIYSPYEP